MFEVDERIGRPEFSPQLLTGDKLPRSLEKNSQYLQGAPLNRYADSGTAQFSGLKVEFEGGEADDLLRILALHLSEFRFSKPTTRRPRLLNVETGRRCGLELLRVQPLTNGREWDDKKRLPALSCGAQTTYVGPMPRRPAQKRLKTAGIPSKEKLMITKKDSAAIEQSVAEEHNFGRLNSRAGIDGYFRRRGLWRLGVGVLMKGDAHGQPPPLQIIALAQAYSPDHNVILHLKGPTDVLQTELIFQQGGTTGWHYHPGPVVVMIKAGALTEIESNGCMTVHQAGSAFFEDANVVHNVVNLAGVVTDVYATFLSPTGAQPLIPAADPGSVCRN